jgi:hypothetical protein
MITTDITQPYVIKRGKPVFVHLIILIWSLSQLIYGYVFLINVPRFNKAVS